MHRICNLINTDLKPENVLLQLNEKEKSDLMSRMDRIEEKLTKIGHPK